MREGGGTLEQRGQLMVIGQPPPPQPPHPPQPFSLCPSLPSALRGALVIDQLPPPPTQPPHILRVYSFSVSISSTLGSFSSGLGSAELEAMAQSRLRAKPCCCMAPGPN